MAFMRSLSLDEKTTILAFRGVIFLLLCFFLLYNPEVEQTLAWRPFLLVGIYLLSNLALIPLPKSQFQSSLLPVAIFLFDTAWISWVIYSSEGLNSDLYLVYFLVVFMSGLQMKVWQSFLIGTVASLLYIGLWAHTRPNEDFLNTHTLLRMPFFYLVSFFTAYFAQQVQERESHLKKQYGLELAKAERRAMAGRLAGKIAFEMNNPLSVVIGFAQSLLKRMDTSDPQHLAAQHMLQGANRCREMIENLLLLSDEAWATMDAVAMNSVILDTVDALKKEGLLVEKSVELREELEEGMPFIRAERRQLSRAIRELIKNSLEAMPEGGILALRTCCVRQPGVDEIQCEVEDSGHGIAAVAAAQIFEPFFTTKEGEGQGLGLSYVSAIVHRHRGTIQFDSRPGQGSKFTMRIPVNAHGPASGDRNGLKAALREIGR